MLTLLWTHLSEALLRHPLGIEWSLGLALLKLNIVVLELSTLLRHQTLLLIHGLTVLRMRHLHARRHLHTRRHLLASDSLLVLGHLVGLHSLSGWHLVGLHSLSGRHLLTVDSLLVWGHLNWAHGLAGLHLWTHWSLLLLLSSVDCLVIEHRPLLVDSVRKSLLLAGLLLCHLLLVLSLLSRSGFALSVS